ncbi:MobQ family relaxase [Paenibacillus jiagnxiensis]|uniref:MobQ family relaxase n=1 Tax=Paenibacillus jiagnxiensis TaxID=3228926 RepID=UPI0033B3B4E0
MLAIYHLSAQVISRSDGRSAVAAAAYRAGEKLFDERLGQIHNFERKRVAARHIMAPADAPEWVYNRQTLWNAVEASEKRKDAQVCREIEISLPVELSHEQQELLIKGFCQEQFVDRGMIADLGVHLNDPGNPHVHIMLTTREITPEGFGKKKREWNDRALLQDWREQWSAHANRALERAGIDERIDHRSFIDQGITDRLPTIHEGPIARVIEQRGGVTDRGEINRRIREHNAQVLYLEKYRREKDSLQRKMLLHPEERRSVSDAEQVIQQPAEWQTIQRSLEQLKQQLGQLEDQEGQLRANLKPFDMGDMYFKNIEQWEQSLQETGSFKRLFNKQERDSHSFLQQRIVDTKNKLHELGFKDRDKFEARKAKVVSYTQSQLQEITNARRRLLAERDVLLESQNILKRADMDSVRSLYPEWPGAAHLSPDEARAILDLNERYGRVMQPTEIDQAYHQARSRTNNHIESPVFQDQGKSRSPSEVAGAHKDHHMDPAFGFLKEAFHAVDRANKAAQRHDAEKEWQNKKRNRDRGRYGR